MDENLQCPTFGFKQVNCAVVACGGIYACANFSVVIDDVDDPGDVDDLGDVDDPKRTCAIIHDKSDNS